MRNKNSKTIALIVASLQPGGMERIMAEVANYFSTDEQLNIHLIVFSNKKPFYELSSNVTIHKPKFEANNRAELIYKNFIFLRNVLKQIKPYSALSFGSMYNSFVLLASVGLGIKVYVSDRSNPYRNTRITFKNDPIRNHDGILHYLLKKYLYKISAGIFVQTELAKKIENEFTGHKNIIHFPNPAREIKVYPSVKRKKWIINVGRFTQTKNQSDLVEIFAKTNPTDWELVFAGDGPELQAVKKLVVSLGIGDTVCFLGNVSEVDYYLRKSEIFAFTSLSEGFPNALLEAMNASLACIAYDCTAGPSDIIKDGKNGFLVPTGSKKIYKEKLDALMNNEGLRSKFQREAHFSMEKYDPERILRKIKLEMIS